MKKLFLVLSLIFNLGVVSHGQLSVLPADASSNTLQTMVKSLVGTGVQVSNITSNQQASSVLFGTFTEPSGQLGIKKGLLMTSGTVQNAVGPNNTSSVTGNQSLPGDLDLANLVGDFTYDACVIEFDIVTNSSEISFNYIFASEEYLEFVGSSFNDVFAFLISGPGIIGTKNIALVPSTLTPVAINNVNNISNPSFYIDNGTGTSGGGPIVQYDGYTVKLKAVAQVQPCKTYHLKLAITDVGDSSYDSGVFIESGSLSGLEAIRINNIVAPDSLFVCPSEFPITLQAGVNPVPNYSWTKDGIQVATGNQFYNATDEGWYNVKAYIQPSCFWTDSIKIIKEKDFDLIMSPDTGVCVGGSTNLKAAVIGGNSNVYNYAWSSPSNLNSSTIPDPLATVFSNTTFQVICNSRCYADTSDVTISVYPPAPVSAFGDTTICYGGTAYLNADYFTQYQYAWAPANTLSNAFVFNPEAKPLKSTDYVLSVNNRGCVKTDTVYVIVKEEVKAEILLPVRHGAVPWKLKLRNVSKGASDYTWYISGFDSLKVFEPTVNITKEDYYSVVLKAVNSLGCFDYDTIVVQAYKLFIPNLITPNGDGRNDSFEITGIGDAFGIEIYNRWGDRVYKKSHYQNEWAGEGLSDGIYYFIIYDLYLDTEYKGWVQLLR